MSLTMHVDVVSAEKTLFSGTAKFLVAPTVEGEVGIMPRHNQLIAQLKPGEVRISLTNDERLSIYVSGGILEVQKHVVTVLSDIGIEAADLDEARALELQRQAEAALADQQSDINMARARAELLEATTQLSLIRKLRKS